MAGHGSWTRWRRAPAMTSPGFASIIRSSRAKPGDVMAGTWFRLHHPIIAGAGPLSSVLGPADWTHGIARPLQDVVADPNPNLTVQLFRPPSGDWVGVRAQTRWRPATGCGVGSGTLLDTRGEIGRGSMSVVLGPVPKAAERA